MPGWLMSIIGLIVQLVVGRLMPMSTQQAQRQRTDEERLARAVVHQFPVINFECLLKVLPDALDELAKLAREGKFSDVRALADLGLRTLTSLLRCQFGMVVEGVVSAQAEAALNEKLLKCGVAAVVSYFQTNDIGKAITGFINCLFSGNGNTQPPTNPNDPPGGGGGISPQEPILRETRRCLQ
jgi:hypothetical protein